MRPVVPDWTTVVAGSWNLAILNPDWVAREILHVEEVQLEVLVGTASAPDFRFTSGGLMIVPRNDRVMVAPGSTEREALLRAERVAIELMNELPRTPISAVGVNFGYIQEGADADLTSLFTLDDNEDLARLDLIIATSQITRAVPVDDRVLNYTLSLDENGNVKFNFNFHKPVVNAEQGVAALQGMSIHFKEKAEEILANVYNVRREELNG